jgi:hypothetical protein
MGTDTEANTIVRPLNLLLLIKEGRTKYDRNKFTSLNFYFQSTQNQKKKMCVPSPFLFRSNETTATLDAYGLCRSMPLIRWARRDKVPTSHLSAGSTREQ